MHCSVKTIHSNRFEDLCCIKTRSNLMAITNTDLVPHIRDEYGQTLLSGLTFTPEYSLERFIFDLLDSYAKTQVSQASAGVETNSFVKSGTVGLLQETDNGEYKFTKTFTVSGEVTVGIDSFSPSRG